MAETLIFPTGSRIVSGTLTSTASIRILNVDEVSGSFTGSFTGSLLGSIDSASFAETASFVVGPLSDIVISGTLEHTGSAKFFGDLSASGPVLLTGQELTILNDSDPRIFIADSGVGGTQLVIQAVGDAFDSVKRGLIGTTNSRELALMVNNNVKLVIGTGGDLAYTGSIHVSQLIRTDIGQILIGYDELLTDLADPRKSDGSVLSTVFAQLLGTGDGQQSFTIGGFKSQNFGPSLMFVKSRQGTIGSHSLITNGAILGNVVWTADDGDDYGTVPARIRALVDDASPGSSSIGGEIRLEVATGLLEDELLQVLRLRSDLSAHFSGSGNFTGSLEVVEGVTSSFTGTFVGDFTGSTSFTGSFTGGMAGDGAGLTGVVSVSHATDSDTAVLAVSAVTALTASLASTASFLLGSPQTGVAVTDVAIHAALVALGLITA